MHPLNYYAYRNGNSVSYMEPQGLRRLDDCEWAIVEQAVICLVGVGGFCLADFTKVGCTVAAIVCVYACLKAVDICECFESGTISVDRWDGGNSLRSEMGTLLVPTKYNHY